MGEAGSHSHTPRFHKFNISWASASTSTPKEFVILMTHKKYTDNCHGVRAYTSPKVHRLLNCCRSKEEGETYILAGDFEVVTPHSPPPFG